MLKNITAYRINPGWDKTTEQVESGLALARFSKCGATQEQSAGWSEPRGIAHAALVEPVGKNWILRLTSESKVLPANVVHRATEERIEKLEDQMGRKLGRVEKRDIREEMRLDLLPRAFTRIAHTTVWINRQAGLLLIDATSPKCVDLVIALLLRCLDGLELTPFFTNHSPAIQMSAWLLAHEAPGRFDIEEDCEIRATDDSHAVVRYTHHSLNRIDVRKHIENEGKLPTRLALTWNGRVSFVLTDKWQVKRIKFLEGVFQGDSAIHTTEEAADRFEADWTIVTSELDLLVRDLIEALGGAPAFTA